MRLRLRRPQFPLLKRELVGLLRTKRAFWLLVTTVALSATFAIIAWPSERSGPVGLGMETIVTLMSFLLAQLATALLVVPALAGGAISGERERDTYDLLYSTLLRPSSIVLSKAGAAVGYLAMLLLASAPAACVLYLLGGVAFWALMEAYAVSFAALVMTGLVCLAQSMRSARTAQAAVRGVVWTIFWNGGLTLLIYLGIGVAAALSRWNQPPPYFFLVSACSPFSVIPAGLFSTSYPGAAQMQQFFGPLGFTELFLGYAAIVSALHLAYLLWKVRTPELAPSRRVERRKLRAQAVSGGRPRGIRRSWFTRELLRLGDVGSPFIGNPVFLKEVRSEFFGRPWFRRTLFFAPIVLCLAISLIVRKKGSRDIDVAPTIIGIVMVSLVLTSFLAPAVSASAIPREIEQGNLDFLRGTLLPLREVLFGKLLGSLYATGGLVAGTAAAVFSLALFGLTGGEGIGWTTAGAVGVLGVTWVFTTSLATLASALSRKTMGALAIAYGATGLVFIGWPILVSLANTADVVPILVATSPFVALMQGLERTFLRRSSELLGWLTGFFCVYGATSVILALAAAAVLERRRARDR